MEVSNIIAEIDVQIQKLQQARNLLAGSEEAPRRGPGRPKGSTKAAVATAATPTGERKRKLSPEGRKRIAEAMKRRWAERAKANGKA